MSTLSQLDHPNLPVVTGLGALCSIGRNVPAFWESVRTGRNGAREVRSFDTSQLRNQVGCEVAQEDLEAALDALGQPHWRGLPRASRLACVAGAEALAHAELDGAEIDGLCVGTTTIDMPEVEDRLSGYADPTNAEPIADVVEESFAGRIGRHLGINGPALTVATSCSAGNIAICRALDLIRTGRAHRMLVGGSDAFSKVAFVGFSRMRAMAPEICAPFSNHRRGMLLGEGSAFLVVESLRSARRRGAQVLAAAPGYGLSCDAHHIATPAPNGRGAAEAMRRALADSGVDGNTVDYVCAHGTGTFHNDLAESKAITDVLGERRPFVSSLKALTGHCLGAASALEAVASVLSLTQQRWIPAWNVQEQDERCTVRLPLPDTAGEIPTEPSIQTVLSNALAFGGNNSCLVLKRFA
ncbi:MAG: beta-ketoacyl-[acyl-carrier-protein] synthase family protein [Acidobacteriota bacterium]